MSTLSENFIKSFMASIEAKNPGEPEFHQAVRVVATSLADYIVDRPYLVDQKIEDAHLETAFEKREVAYFVASKNHPLVNKKHLTLEEITKEPLILTEPNASYRRLLDLDLASHSIEIAPVIEAENTDLIISLVKGTNGVTFLPNYILYPHLKDGSLVKLDVDYKVNLSRQIIHHKDKWISKEMKSFIEELERI